MTPFDYDAIVIGSGFGGSVAALRLSEKGYRVAVLEQGRRFDRSEMEKSTSSMRELFWMPALGLKGPFTQRFFQHVNIVGGVGVWGGSLVYAAVLLEPKTAFYYDPAGLIWASIGKLSCVRISGPPRECSVAQPARRPTCKTNGSRRLPSRWAQEIPLAR